jgi:hypothetical protein
MGEFMVFDPINDIEFFDDAATAVEFADGLAAELAAGPQPEAAEAVMVCRVMKRYDDDTLSANAN